MTVSKTASPLGNGLSTNRQEIAWIIGDRVFLRIYMYTYMFVCVYIYIYIYIYIYNPQNYSDATWVLSPGWVVYSWTLQKNPTLFTCLYDAVGKPPIYHSSRNQPHISISKSYSFPTDCVICRLQDVDNTQVMASSLAALKRYMNLILLCVVVSAWWSFVVKIKNETKNIFFVERTVQDELKGGDQPIKTQYTRNYPIIHWIQRLFAC